MAYTKDELNAMYGAASYDESRASGASLEDSAMDYLVYGTTGAAASAAVGIANSMIGIGRGIGVTDADYIDERDTIRTAFGEDAAGFYSRHKTGVDLAGMLVGTIATGAAATAGLRALQVSGRLGGSYQLATGMKNADLVLGSSAVRSAAASAVNGVETASLTSRAMFAAYAQGVKQVALENLVGITVSSVMNNQNIFLNEGHKKSSMESTYEIMKDNIMSGWFVVGTGVQVGFETAKIAGHVSKVVQAKDLEAYNKFFKPVMGELESFVGLEPGDALVKGAKAKSLLRESPDFIAASKDPSMAGRARRAMEIADNAIMQQVTRAVEEVGSPDAKKFLATKLMDMVNQPYTDELADRISGMSKAGIVQQEAAESMAEFYKKTSAPVFIYELMGVDARRHRAEFYRKAVDSFKSGVKATDEQASAFAWELRDIFGEVVNETGTASGGAIGHQIDGIHEKVKQLMQFDGGFLEVLSMRSISPPTGVLVNKGASAIDDGFLQNVNAGRKLLGLEEISKQEYSDAVFMHEMGHLKNNTRGLINTVQKMLESPESKLLDEMYISIKESRVLGLLTFGKSIGEDFSTVEGFKDAIRRRPEILVHKGLSAPYGNLTSPIEMLADAASFLTNPRTRELASRRAPTMAALFQKFGGLAEPWTDNRLFLNTRTGERLTSALAHASDLGKSVLKDGKVLHTAYQGGKQKILDYSLDMFKRVNPADLEVRKDYFQASAMYAAKSSDDIWKNASFNDTKEVAQLIVQQDDLPTWEFAIKQAYKNMDEGKFLKANIMIQSSDGKLSRALSLADAQEELVAYKKLLRTEMASVWKYNEQEIAHILNIDTTAAMGMDGGEWLLSNVRNFDEPELIQLDFKPVDIVDEGIRARSYAQHEINVAKADFIRQNSAAELLGENYKLFEDIEFADDMEAVTQMDSRTSLLKSAKHAYNSVRATAGAIGKTVAHAISGSNEEILKSFQPWNAWFQASENLQARSLLAATDNFIRGNKSVLGKFDDGDHVVIALSDLPGVREAFIEHGFWPEELGLDELRSALRQGERLPQEAKKIMEQFKAITLDKASRVGEFLEFHRANNSSLLGKKALIAKARGSSLNLADDVLYAAPMDLKSTPHVAFVIPNEIYGQSDPRKFMVYGSTAQELEEKINAIYSSAGGRYKVVGGGKGGDVELYKKMVGDYEKGQVFDEQFFDAAKFKTGSSAQLKPNLDLYSSSTLNRYTNWTLRQNEYIIRSGVELKYADKVAELQWMDRAARKTEQGLFGWKKQESIYKDTLNMMLDIRSQGDELQQLYKRVNDFVGEKGSELLTKAWGGVRDLQRPMTLEDFEEINSTLEAAGLGSPYKTLNEMVVSSPDVAQSRQLNGLVRSMNSIVATLGLRLDFANSIVQVASAPILTAPILRTALQEMPKGAAKDALQDLVSVRVPGSNLREPTPMKLMLAATKNFFTKEGKEKMARYVEQGLVPDFLDEYLNVMDDLALSGNHTVSEAMQKFERAAKFGSRITQHQQSEAFTRYIVADAIEQIGKARGLTAGEIRVAQINAIDQVHGIQRYAAKPQLFNGVVGQAIGLYQSYMFNMMHNVARFAAKGDRKNIAIMAGLQTGIYGLQGLPGFDAMNASIMRANGDHFDLYAATGADTDDKGFGSYLLYGSASHILSTPLDLAGRGGLTPRNPLLIPTDAAQIPAVSIFAKGVANIWNTAGMIAGGDVSVMDGVLHGLAHNGFNRPLQGLANIARGYTDTAQGQPLFTSANHVNYNELEELNLAAITARLLGTRPLKESIILNTKYRQDAYQAELRKRTEKLGEAVKISLAAGAKLTPEMVRDYALKYEAQGLPIEGFNAFWGRQLSAVSKEDMKTFQQTLANDRAVRDSINRMKVQRSKVTPWQEMDHFQQ